MIAFDAMAALPSDNDMPRKNKFTASGHSFNHYYSIQFKCAPDGGKMTDAFNFQALMYHAHAAAQKVKQFLAQNNFLHQVGDIRALPHENRMIVQCPDTLVKILRTLDCVDSVRPLGAAEMNALKAPRPPQI